MRWQFAVLLFTCIASGGCDVDSPPDPLSGALLLFRSNGVNIGRALESYVRETDVDVGGTDDFDALARRLTTNIAELKQRCGDTPTTQPGFDQEREDLAGATTRLAVALQIIAYSRNWPVKAEIVEFKDAVNCPPQTLVRLDG